MKKTCVILILLMYIASGCSSSQYDYIYKEIQYVQTTIANVNDYTITLSNGLVLRSRQLTIAVNSTPILLVIDNNLRSGYFYNRNSKVNVTFGNLFEPDLMVFNEGYLHFVHDIDPQNKIITLIDGSTWFVPRDEDISKAKKLLTNPEIIIPINKSMQGTYFINTVSSESILVLRVDSTI
ncbi:MAG: hypothetical protein K8F36_07105 [Melioribacteraceae bacterium]|nr:hypothetical protein [Melioribacteraceae bacterium]